MATYIGIGRETGNDIPADDALDYALAECGLSIDNQAAEELESFLDWFEDWFFQCNWVLVEEDENA